MSRHAPDRSPGTPLTERESQVLDLVAEGLTRREMAERLFLSESTVKTHLHHALGKLGARTAGQAAVLHDRQKRGV